MAITTAQVSLVVSPAPRLLGREGARRPRGVKVACNHKNSRASPLVRGRRPRVVVLVRSSSSAEGEQQENDATSSFSAPGGSGTTSTSTTTRTTTPTPAPSPQEEELQDETPISDFQSELGSLVEAFFPPRAPKHLDEENEQKAREKSKEHLEGLIPERDEDVVIADEAGLQQQQQQGPDDDEFLSKLSSLIESFFPPRAPHLQVPALENKPDAPSSSEVDFNSAVGKLVNDFFPKREPGEARAAAAGARTGEQSASAATDVSEDLGADLAEFQRALAHLIEDWLPRREPHIHELLQKKEGELAETKELEEKAD